MIKTATQLLAEIQDETPHKGGRPRKRKDDKQPSEIMIQLKSRRLLLGWTQLELATKAGVTQSMVGEWETGWHQPSAANVVRLTEAMGGKVTLEFDDLEETP